MILHITVKPGSRKDDFIVEADGAIKVKIKEQPLEGKANKYLAKYLSEIFGVPQSRIEILKGENNPHKKIQVDVSEDAGNAVLVRYKK